MQAIVSLVDPHASIYIQDLWSELASSFGLHGIYQTPFPHISYHVAESYQDAWNDPVFRVMRQLAQHTHPFTVSSSGLGMFTGPGPVLYIPIVRTQALALLHQHIWEALEPYSHGAVQHYHPQAWLPHISLALDDLDHKQLSQVILKFSSRSFTLEMKLNNLCMFIETSSGYEPRVCLDFEAEDDNGLVDPGVIAP